METWVENVDLENTPHILYRNEFAKKIKNLNPEKIIQLYTYQNMKSASNLISIIDNYFTLPLSGIGVELGAGTGLFSNAFILYGAKKIYAVEIIPEITKNIIPKVAEYYLKNNSTKIISVNGSFDNIRLPNNSIDFIFQYDSFHHSFNLGKTFKESYKKLKRGGVLVMIDRCHPDSFTNEKVNYLLNIKYDEKQLVDQGFPKGMGLTRRESGEHEYRRREWLIAINNAGFKIKLFRTFYNKITLKQLYWYFLGKINNPNEYCNNLLIIYLAQNFGIYFRDKHTLTPMKETGFNYKTLGILIKK
ncbi:class I SAM-dependent methyltransferase [Candidatus Marinimicrobia bacterium]|nr:class I SAM-dependent methyltransferase [Candidatus Neomarinimicrobiota bacterium]